MKLSVIHCVHCGTIWIVDDEDYQTYPAMCPCGAEWHPVSKILKPGKLKLGDGFIAIVAGDK